MSSDSERCKTVYRVGLRRKTLCKLDLIIAENRNYPTVFMQSLMMLYVIGRGTDATFASRVLHWTIDVHMYLFWGRIYALEIVWRVTIREVVCGYVVY